MKTRIGVSLAALAFAMVFLSAASGAFAYNETGWPAGSACNSCHHPGFMGQSSGPHSGYTASTDACGICHTTHDAPGAAHLLPGDTVKAACQVCHDGTAGRGVYGAIVARGLIVGAQHRNEATTAVPGGSASDGATSTMTLSGTGGTLTCSDCHSPHGNNLVTAFLGERQREPEFDRLDVPTSSRLLKKHPGSVVATVADYGSDWCLACHKGRASGGPVHNHPAESLATTTSPYVYRAVGIIGPGPYPTSVTTVGPAGINTKSSGYNRAYLMPFPRTGAQAGHNPICQQCHEDMRNVGTLTADGTQASPSVANLNGYPAGDGRSAADNPRFQNFPHETQGYRMLVEAATTSSSDDLCLNCHPAVALP